MGMIVSVFKNPLGDCTNGGISSNVTRLCIVNIEGPFDPSDDMPAAILAPNQVGNPVIKPAFCAMHKEGQPWEVAQGWFMMGGNFAYTSDSRFNEAVTKYCPNFYGAVPIHDRQE